ncbi:hypothetical protein D3C76_1511540 [compost metagenome]
MITACTGQLAPGTVATLFSIAAWVNSRRGIPPRMPSALRVGDSQIGTTSLIISRCARDLWQLRSISRVLPSGAAYMPTILFEVEVPLVTI